MKALLIDAGARIVSEVEYHADPKVAPSLQDLIGGYIETGFIWPNGDVLYVDEEGLYKPQSGFFQLMDRRDGQPLCGKGVVVGREVEDDSPQGFHTDPPTITVERLMRRLRWLSVSEAKAWAAASGLPASAFSTVKPDGTVVTETFGTMRDLYAAVPEAKPEPGKSRAGKINTTIPAGTTGNSLWEDCPRCGQQPVWMPLLLCSDCWPEAA